MRWRGLPILVLFISAIWPLAVSATGTLDQSNETCPVSSNSYPADYHLAQTFTVGLAGDLDSIDLKGFKQTTLTGTISVSIFAVDGDNKPTGSVLTGTTFLANTLPLTTADWYHLTFTPIAVSVGQHLAITFVDDTTDYYANWSLDFGNPYAGGRYWENTPWSGNAGYDFCFRTYVSAGGSPSPSAGPAATSSLTSFNNFISDYWWLLITGFACVVFLGIIKAFIIIGKGLTAWVKQNFS